MLVVLLAEWSPRGKEGNGVDPIEAGKEEPGNQKSVCSFLSKLSFRSTIESIEGRDAGEEKEHRHLPDLHEDDPIEGEIVEKIVAPPVTFHIVTGIGGISTSSVVEENAPGERNPDQVYARKSRRNSIVFKAGLISILLIFSCSHQSCHSLQRPDPLENLFLMRNAADLKCTLTLTSGSQKVRIRLYFNLFDLGELLCYYCLRILERTFQRIPNW